MKHIFIVNPAAGKRGTTDKLLDHLRRRCPQLGLDYVVTLTEERGDATRITRGWAQAGEPARIYACGGDGTLNEVIQAAAGCEHLAVTNIPKGTGNDFLKLFGPENRGRFTDIKALAEGPQSALDLMDCNGTLGLDIVCAGVDARIAADVHRYSALPLVGGMGAYVASLVANVLFKGISRPMRVAMGDRSWDEPVSVLCICNGRYYGGGFMPVADAMPDDGILDVLLVPHVSRPTFFRLVGKYAKGRYAELPQLVRDYHGPGPITFSADEPITVVVDGEVLRDTLFRVQLSDKKVNFFYPADVSWRDSGTTASAGRRYVPEKH